MLDFEARCESVALAAWERWTNNGLHMSGDVMSETFKSAFDAAANSYFEDANDVDWWRETCRRLGVESGED